MRILAVDDDPMVLDLLGIALEQNGFCDITFAITAEDALELIEVAREPYDVFLLDVMLPGTSGIEVCRTLRTRQRYRATPVLMITGSRAHDMMTRAFDAGATDFVSKPFDAMELVTRIKLAVMLCGRTQRERMNDNSVKELDGLTDVSFDERFDLPKGCGLTGFLTLENELLRHADVVYEMASFSVEVDNALGLFRGSRPAQFRASIEAVGSAVCGVFDKQFVKLAYAGRGAIFGIAHKGAQFRLGAAQKQSNAALAQNWDSFITGQPQAPTLTIQRLEGPPNSSGRAIADLMRSFQGRVDLWTQADPFIVNGLFDRLSVRIAGG